MRLLIPLLLAALAGGCASSGAVPRPFPGAPVPRRVPGAPVPPGVPGAPAPPAAGDAPAPSIATGALIATALSYRGVPYRNGGSDPSGFDCSGLVQYVFGQHGVGLPREVRDQYRLGRDVSLAGIAPGDLIFFATATDSASHVGLAIGSDEFVHAPSSRGVVRVERFSAPYWASRIVGVRRITQR